MTAHVSRKHRFDHPAASLTEALADPDFHDAKVRFVGERGSELVSLDTDPDGSLVVVTRQWIDRGDLPSLARRFAGGDVCARRTETWKLSGTWSTGEFTVSVPGAPMDSGGRISLLDVGEDACTLRVSTYISVSTPLMSRSIERAMAENVGYWLDQESDFTARWLDDRRLNGPRSA